MTSSAPRALDLEAPQLAYSAAANRPPNSLSGNLRPFRVAGLRKISSAKIGAESGKNIWKSAEDRHEEGQGPVKNYKRRIDQNTIWLVLNPQPIAHLLVI